jgi:High-temperature-induced dauer-formation protein
MSSPGFLLARETNPALLHILLEEISTIVEHQHSQNPLLLYAIIRNHAKFEALQHFDLETAQNDLRERRKPKEDKSVDATKVSIEMTTPTTPFIVGDEYDSDHQEEQEDYYSHRPMSEKALGKLPEGSVLPRRESTFSLRSATALLSPSANDSTFVPTPNWVSSWLPYLPLHSILQVIQQLEPEVTSLIASLPTPSTRPVLDHLRHSSSLLYFSPTPPSPDPFQWSPPAVVWYKTFLWGQIFAAEAEFQGGSLSVWRDTEVRLFRVQRKEGEGLKELARDGAARKVDQMARGVWGRIGESLGRREGEGTG